MPKRNVIKSFFHNDVRLGLEKTVHRFKDEITNEVDAGRLANLSRNSSSSERTMVERDIAQMEQDVKTADAELHDPEKIAHITTAEFLSIGKGRAIVGGLLGFIVGIIYGLFVFLLDGQ